ncbi:hypothetical protein LRM47_00800 [Candidatus Nanosynbacter sp. TM7-076]|jgi:hypothetical protein|uniref:hypothetical protein n=1 Tax=Candidatus Nanosynbacter sp. TM7-076 TaxID=2902629 RepID=UPI001FB61885|nr:hypothetical protein [Candidatus Nanosynbacter sp. TM7-076]MCJ1967578.1 hypothetical protein [Candidatus Nanosynbacter sp. TM7-076]DAK87026.1 MAG TPA: hypothetical protein [Caudoviricetes sp.]
MKNNTKNINESKKNNINWKQLLEKAKSILLIIMITAAIAFYAGIQYQINKTEEVDNKVRQATLQLKK